MGDSPQENPPAENPSSENPPAESLPVETPPEEVPAPENPPPEDKQPEAIKPEGDSSDKAPEKTPEEKQPSPPADEEFSEMDYLSEQFQNYLRIAKALLKTLEHPKDIRLSTETISKLERLNDSKNLKVKTNNNIFFRYYLKVMNWTSLNQPLPHYTCWYPKNKASCNAAKVTESRTWLEDNKSYIALQSLGDGSTLVYGAVATNPDAGWEPNGLQNLEKRISCSN